MSDEALDGYTAVSMFVRDVGRGPAVVLLHGTPSPASDWFPLIDALAPRYRVLAPDLPGYGKSAAPPSAMMEAVGDQLAAMLDAHDATRVHAVIGYSTGAYRALDLVLRAGIEANVVVSIAGVAAFDQGARALRNELAHRLDADPNYLGSDEVAALMSELMLSDAWRAAHPDDDRRVREWVRTTTPAALAAELRGLARSRDLRPELPRLRARLYARVGTLDRGCPVGWSEEMTALAPRATLELVIGCGHALLIEDGPATVAAITRELGEGHAPR